MSSKATVRRENNKGTTLPVDVRTIKYMSNTIILSDSFHCYSPGIFMNEEYKFVQITFEFVLTMVKLDT